LKTDFLGSSEVLEETLAHIPQTDVFLNIVSSGVGDVNLSDIKFAKSAGAVMIGFRVKIHPAAAAMAEREKSGLLPLISFMSSLNGYESIWKK